MKRNIVLLGIGRLWRAVCLACLGSSTAFAGELWVGSAQVDITPDRPVALAGSFRNRISPQPATPIIAAALAIESREAGKPADQLLLVTCDLVAIRDGVQERFRQLLAPRLPGLDMRKVVLTATHTHTAPVTTELRTQWYLYEVPKEGVIHPDEYMDFLYDRLVQVAISAWGNREPAGVSWTLGHAVVGQNRRAVYADGRAQMYGKTNDPGFRGLEGAEDHAVETLFFWTADRRLKALAINLACPAQAAERGASETLNADFWHEVREQLKRKLQVTNLPILGWTGAGGDQSPHLMYRQAAEQRMLKARGLTQLQELGRRISNAVLDTLDVAKAEIHTDLEFVHTVRDLELPPRKILRREYEDSKAKLPALAQKEDIHSRTMAKREREILSRYESADREPPYVMELHVVRIGDIALATNPFELFLDYGVQIKARSPALQTLIIQHATNAGLYLPTAKAIEGGGYSGLPHTNLVGPEGGQILVDRTVEALTTLWPQK